MGIRKAIDAQNFISIALEIIESPFMGFAERLTIIASLQWMFFLVLKMYTTEKKSLFVDMENAV